MDDLLLILGLASVVYAAFLFTPIVGFVVLGAALILLSFAAKDVKIKLPRVEVQGAPVAILSRAVKNARAMMRASEWGDSSIPPNSASFSTRLARAAGSSRWRSRSAPSWRA
jgi:hypothetical protein